MNFMNQIRVRPDIQFLFWFGSALSRNLKSNTMLSSKRYPHRQREQSQNNNHVQYLENIFAHKGNLITMIRFYAGHECLWNKRHADYPNLRKRNQLWSWIAKQFGPGVSGSEVECVIHGLRRQALAEFRRIEACKMRGGLCGKPSFDLLEEFQFLLPEVVKVESQTPTDAPAHDLQPSLTVHQPASIALEDSGRLQETDEDSQEGSCEAARDDLDEFCFELRQELGQLAPDVCLKAQKKILLVMHETRVKRKPTKIKPILKKFVHWNLP